MKTIIQKYEDVVGLKSKEKKFISESLIAMLNGARIGKDHYSITLTRIELTNLIDKLN